MNVKMILSTSDDASFVKNMYPLYLHDLSQFSGEGPNEHGILEATAVRTLGEQGDVQNIWWEKPEILLPFIIQADGRAAGFALVARPPHVAENVDYLLQEFFLLHAFRGRGIGDLAAWEIFDRFRGRWELHVLPGNLPAQAFWRRLLRNGGNTRFEERLANVDGGRLVVFRFENSQRI